MVKRIAGERETYTIGVGDLEGRIARDGGFVVLEKHEAETVMTNFSIFGVQPHLEIKRGGDGVETHGVSDRG
jgi:hypothetical protein